MVVRSLTLAAALAAPPPAPGGAPAGLDPRFDPKQRAAARADWEHKREVARHTGIAGGILLGVGGTLFLLGTVPPRCVYQGMCERPPHAAFEAAVPGLVLGALGGALSLVAIIFADDAATLGRRFGFSRPRRAARRGR